MVERRVERFESRHPAPVSRERLQSRLAKAGRTPGVAFTQRWFDDDGRAVLEAEFAPAPGTLRLLRLLSVSMALLLGASAWAIFSSQESGALRWLLPIFTALAILGVPLATAGLGSHRDADEARIRKAIRAALDED